VPNADDPLTDKPRSQREWAAHPAYWKPELIEKDGRKVLRHPRHFACNNYSDAQVGRVLAAIERETPDALTIYTSDHGDMFLGHQLHGKGPCVYEEIARIPFIVRWRGQVPDTAVSDGPVSHIDLVPTLLDYFGVPRPDLLQGKSLLRQFREPQHRTNEHVFMEFNRFELDHDGFGAFAPIRCIFDGRYKLAINLLDTDELYDLGEDPIEVRNRINDPALTSVRDRLHAALLAWMGRTRDPLRGPHWSRRAWTSPDIGSTWGGPTRPRPFDEPWYPKTMLYETGKPIDRYEYAKK
jgi:uncharacterized sulfatase